MSSNVNDTDERAAFVQGLRDLADFLEQHPDANLPVPHTWRVYDYKGEIGRLLDQARRLGGPWEIDERPQGPRFDLIRHFGPIPYQLYTDAENVGALRYVQRTATEWTIHDDVREQLAELVEA